MAPPQTTITLPVQIAVWSDRAVGASVVLIAAHVSVSGLYRAPVLNGAKLPPPQTTISSPVQTAT